MYHIIVNPASKSGKGTKIWAQIEPVLKEKNVEYLVHFSKQAGHVITLVKEICEKYPATSEKPLKLIALGGDGTLNEVLQGIHDFDLVQVGYIPTGSSNDMARDLSLIGDPQETLEKILNCKVPTRMDLGKLTLEHISDERSRNHNDDVLMERYFGVGCGIGFDAAVCEEALASSFKNILNKMKLGKLTYLTIALKQIIASKKIPCDVTIDDDQTIHLNRFLFVAGMVHQYEGGGFKFCPGANYKDGILDICVVGDISKGVVLMALPAAFKGNHFKFNGIDRYAAKKLTIKTAAPLWVHTDGEVSVKADQISMTCEKEKLQMLF